MLASEAALWLVFAFFDVACGGDVDEGGEDDDMAQAARRPNSRHSAQLSGWSKVRI